MEKGLQYPQILILTDVTVSEEQGKGGKIVFTWNVFQENKQGGGVVGKGKVHIVGLIPQPYSST